jgi:MoaA/NifB/PqqE/SkfB family radical SAM enzyme
MIEQILRAPGYYIARHTGRHIPLPSNLTFSVSYRCNSRCVTCNVWRKRVADFTLEEYERTFRKLGRSLRWVTFSGGEPFLRPDLPEIVLACARICQPDIINIPTNGILVERVAKGVERIVREAPNSKLVINLSLDGIGAEHDQIRGVPGNYVKLRETYAALRELNAPNLTVGIHSVISQHNIARFPALREHVRNEIDPDSFITELAEERVELDTIGLDITPPVEQYATVVDQLVDDIDAEPAGGIAAIAQAFRRHYYQVARQTLTEQRQILPCYAGIASGHIAPNGDVWTCCIRAEPIGSLRDTDYDLRPIWASAKADTLRGSIKRGECHCPLANAAYSSMLNDPPSLARVGINFARLQMRRLARRKEAVR